MDTIQSIEHGNAYPYDSPTPPKDWAHSAARGIIADLMDRSGFSGFEEVAGDIRNEIVETMSEIIREAAGDNLRVADQEKILNKEAKLLMKKLYEKMWFREGLPSEGWAMEEMKKSFRRIIR